jgi:tetratricopeptide (TPR) repeat protein
MVANRARILLLLCIAIALLGVVIWPAYAVAQFGSLSDSATAPQARSQDELDAYLQIVGQTSDEEVVKEVAGFVALYPKSELLGVAYQYQMHAYERLGNFDGMLAAGRKSLVNAPDNLDALLTLAPEIANHFSGRSDRDKLLAEADNYAHRALEGLEKVKPPRDLPLDTWDKKKLAMQCKAHEVLGVVAVSQKQNDIAVTEFQTVLHLADPPTGAQYFRLAVALASKGKKREAAEYFHRAIDLGPEQVTKIAQRELDSLSETKP